MSKRILQHPAESTTGKRYWRSLGQLQDTPEFRSWMDREFPQGAAEIQGDDVSRRGFLQFMGASVALAGLSLSACRRPLKNLVPFTKGVEWSVPGKALFFTSAMPSRNGAMPLVVTTFDGRPTKIEGNPMHPVNQGTTDVWAQSSILDLYDPQRSRAYLFAGKQTDAASFENGQAFIVVSKNEGIVYKRIQKNNKLKNKITLESDNPSYQPYQINTADILELWQAQIVIGKVASQQRWDVNSLANLVNNLHDQVSTLKKKMN
jgi:molybdopterin-containing oxidoreductase family iron-sulfur binding subunit